MSKIGKFFKNVLLPVAEIAGSIFLGPEVGAALGIGGTAGTAATAGVLGGLTSGIETGSLKKGLLGAALGGAGGALGAEVGGLGGAALTGAALGADASNFSLKGALLGGASGAGLAALGGETSFLGASGTGGAAATPATGVAGGGSSAAATALPGVAPAGAAGDLTALGDGTLGGNLAGGIGGGAAADAVGVTPGVGLDAIVPGSSTGALTTGASSAGSSLLPNASLSDIGTSIAQTPGVAGAGHAIADAAAPGFLARNSQYILPGAGLLLNASQQGTPPELKALEGQAAALGAQGTELSSYLSSGKLPPGAQAAVDQATNAAKAHTRQQFASMGLTGSSSEAQALAQIDQSASAQAFQMADTLLQQGITASNLSSQLYQMILSNKRADSQDLSQALVEFAAAAQGSSTNPRSITLQLPQAKAA